MRSIEDQRSNILFFNGDMIMGYGKASLPASLTTVPDLSTSVAQCCHEATTRASTTPRRAWKQSEEVPHVTPIFGKGSGQLVREV
jgi:hypothetical protein